MKVQEFIESMGKNVNRTMKNEQVLALVQKQLEIKKYIPINEKKELIDKIIYHSAYYENGMLKISAIDCYMYFTMFTIDEYTNLEIDSVEVCFDTLSKSKLMPIIIAAIGQEYVDVNTLLNLKRDELLENNSLEMQISEFFNNISNDINEFKNNLTNLISDLDIDKDTVLKLIQMISE